MTPGAAPGPTGADMLRAVPRIRRDAPGFLLGVARRFGDVAAFPLPRLPVLLVSGPAGVRRVLQDNNRSYDKGTIQYRSLAAVTGEGLLTSDGAPWLRQRRSMQPAFHLSTLTDVCGRTVDAGVALLDDWCGLPDGAVVDVDAAMMRTTLDVVGHALLGSDLGAADVRDELVDAVVEALDVVVARARSPLPEVIAAATPSARRLRMAVQHIDAAAHDVVARRRAHLEERGAGPADLLDLLLAAAPDPTDGGSELDAERALRDELVTMIVAGHETVAAALTWTWHLLAGHPLAASRLVAELDAVLGPPGSTQRLPGFADLPALREARAVVEETLRLYPPAWVLTRRALVDDVVGGYAVPAGSLVVISPWVVHRRAGSWPDPERFDPGRFRRGDAVERGAYLPFGAGPRLCIGRDFALAEATLLLATLASRLELTRVAGTRVRPEALVTVRPHGGLPMRLSRRRAG